MTKKVRKKADKPRRKKKIAVKEKRPSLDKLLTALRSEPDNLEAAVKLGEYYLLNGSEHKVAEALDSFKDMKFSTHDQMNQRYFSLYTLGLAHARRFGEADQIAQQILNEQNENLDALFVVVFTHLSLREFEKATERSRQFIDAYNRKHIAYYCGTSAHLSQVWNFLGSSLQERGDIDGAIEAFKESYNCDNKNHLPYLNAASLYARRNEIDTAMEIVKTGMKYCRQVEELHLLEKSFRRTATISACMIVKNEEEMLPDCLESIRDWVDEIIIVDTGSTDRTIEIAESFGAKVISQPWEGDFSKHRNYSLDQASSQWLFVIDADERIQQEDVGTILQHINQDNDSILAISVLNVGGKHNEEITSLSSVRFFKRELHLRYEGIVHNQLVVDPTIAVRKIPVNLVHLGYGLSPEKMEAKAQRTIGLLEKQLKDDPNNSFAWYNLAQVLLGMDFSRHPENPNRIINAAEHALKLTEPDSEVRGERNIHLMSLQQLALTYFIKNDLEQSYRYADKALNINQSYLDTLLLMGNLHLKMKEYETAEDYYKKYLDEQKSQEKHPPPDDLILLHPRSRYRAQYGLGVIAQLRGDNKTALHYFNEFRVTAPEYLDTNARIGSIYFDNNEVDRAAEAFQKQLEYDATNRMAIIGSCCINLSRGEGDGIDKVVTQLIKNDQVSPDELIVFAQMFQKAESSTNVALCLDHLLSYPELDSTYIKTAASLYLSIGMTQEAANAYRKTMEEEGESSELLNDLAGCFYRSGNYKEAEEMYVKAIEYEQLATIAFRNLGLTRMKLDKPKEAIIALEKYIELSGEDNDIKHLIGDLQCRTGETASAIETFEGILNNNPSDSLTLFKLSECYRVMGHTDSAIMGYRRVLQLESDFQPAHQRLAELLQPVEHV